MYNVGACRENVLKFFFSLKYNVPQSVGWNVLFASVIHMSGLSFLVTHGNRNTFLN